MKDDRRNLEQQCPVEAQEDLHDIQHEAGRHPISTSYGPGGGSGDGLEDMSDIPHEVSNLFGPQTEFDRQRIRWFSILCTWPVP